MAVERERTQRQTDSSVSADTLSRQLYNLTPGDRTLRTVREDMLKLSMRRGADVQKTQEVAASLLGSGYGYEDVMREGGAADAVLKTLAATNAAGRNVDAKGLVDAITGHLEATGQARHVGESAGRRDGGAGIVRGNKARD